MNGEREVLLAVRDLFFRVKLETALRRMGIGFRRAESAGLTAVARDRTAAVILDLSDVGLDPQALVRAIRGRPDLADLPVIGFAPHADRELHAAGRAAGCTLVVPRSRLSAALPELLAPYLGPQR